MLNRKLYCAAFAALVLTLSACGGGKGGPAPSNPSGPGPIPDPITTTATIFDIVSGGPVASATVATTSGVQSVATTDESGKATVAAVPGAVVRIERSGYHGPTLVRLGADDDPRGSGRYGIMPLDVNIGFTQAFIQPMFGVGYLFKPAGPLRFDLAANIEDRRGLFDQAYAEWNATGCRPTGAVIVPVTVKVDPNDPRLGGNEAITDIVSMRGNWVTAYEMVFESTNKASIETIRHEIARCLGFPGLPPGRSVWGATSRELTELDRLACVYRAHRAPGTTWEDNQTAATP